jgi:hypothetical protein
MPAPTPVLPLLEDPTAWAGRLYDPPLPLDLATAQCGLVSQLRSTFEGTDIQVFGYPDQPENTWWKSNAIGYVLVAYDRTEYSSPLATSSMVQERRVDFEVAFIARTISWADFTSTGVLQALQAVIKSSLTGFRLLGWRNGYFIGENFRERDPRGRPWVYSFHWRTITMELKQEPAIALGTLKKILYLDSSQQTATPQPPAQFTFDPNGNIQLPVGNVSSVVVKDSTGQTTYTLDQDYTVAATLGIVSTIAGGLLAPGVTVELTYSQSEITIVSSSGGSAPLNPSN